MKLPAGLWSQVPGVISFFLYVILIFSFILSHSDSALSLLLLLILVKHIFNEFDLSLRSLHFHWRKSVSSLEVILKELKKKKKEKVALILLPSYILLYCSIVTFQYLVEASRSTCFLLLCKLYFSTLHLYTPHLPPNCCFMNYIVGETIFKSFFSLSIQNISLYMRQAVHLQCQCRI